MDMLVIRVKDRDIIAAEFRFDEIKLFDFVDDGGGYCLRIFFYGDKEPVYFRCCEFSFCFIS